MMEWLKHIDAKVLLANLLTLALFLALVAFAESKDKGKRCEHLIVRLQDASENRFVTERQVSSWLNKGGDQPLEGQLIRSINIRELESQLMSNPFISRAEISHDIKGNLRADIWQEMPIARLFYPQGKDQYISSNGEMLPYSKHFTARVLIVEPWSEKQLNNKELYDSLTYFCQVLHQDPFWQKQLAHVLLDKNGEAVIYPQIGKQRILFGRLELFGSKLEKLKTFYDQIIPLKGYNHYSKVNLKFENQIVCE